MLNKKESDNATRASIQKEMAKPRMAKSVRIAESNLDAERADGRYRDLRIENNLTGDHDEEVRPKKRAHVEVTVTSKPRK